LQTRKRFRLFKTLEDELSATKEFWWSRTPDERMEYLEHVRMFRFGEEAMNAPMVRCYGWRKLGKEPDPTNIFHF
jgi:hypothetical protein